VNIHSNYRRVSFTNLFVFVYNGVYAWNVVNANAHTCTRIRTHWKSTQANIDVSLPPHNMLLLPSWMWWLFVVQLGRTEGCKPQRISGTIATMAPNQKSLQLQLPSDKKQIIAWFPPIFFCTQIKQHRSIPVCRKRRGEKEWMRWKHHLSHLYKTHWNSKFDHFRVA